MKLSHFFASLVGSCAVTVAGVSLLTPGAPPASREDGGEHSNPRLRTAEAFEGDIVPRDATLELDGTVSLVGRSSKGAVVDERLVLFEAQAADEATPAPRVNLALVMDRSGSMRGERLASAKRAAIAAIDRLSEGDSLSVVTFDTTATQVFVGRVDAGGRARAVEAVDAIQLGGDTCISCGLDLALPWLATSEGVRRMVLLSDGDANHGTRDLEGLRRYGRAAAAGSTTITTVGLDVQHDERLLTAISEASSGRHVFADRAGDLDGVFSTEAQRLAASVADRAELRVTLPRGAELVEVADRPSTREGRELRVPVGAFSRGERKTVLLRLRVHGAALEPLAASFRYVDAARGAVVEREGELGLAMGQGFDAAVTERRARSEAAAALREANELIDRGRFDEARARLAAVRASIAATASAPAMATATAVARDFDVQLRALDDAGRAIPTATAASSSSSRAVRVQRKRNWTTSLDLAQ